MPSVLPRPAAPMTSPRSTSGRYVADRVLAQQERHEHHEEAAQPARSAVGLEGERHRSRASVAGCGSVTAARRSARAGGRAAPRRRWSRPARAAGSPRSWPARRARRRSAATTPTRPWTRAPRSVPRRAAPTTPASDTRALALTRVSAGGQQPGDRGGPRHAVRLGRDQHAERGREEPRRSRSTTAVASAQQRKARTAMVDADRPAAAVAEAVEERADQRGDDGEGQHRERRGTARPGPAPRRWGPGRTACRPARSPRPRRPRR